MKPKPEPAKAAANGRGEGAPAIPTIVGKPKTLDEEADKPYPLIAAAKDAAGWELVGAVFQEFIPTVTDLTMLKDFWHDNTGALERLGVADPKLYDVVKGAFTAKRRELQGSKEKRSATD